MTEEEALDRIAIYKQKLAEVEAKIRILQENVGALVDQKVELMEESARLKRDNERHLHAIEVLTGQIEKLQGMGIQQNMPGAFAELVATSASERRQDRG